METDTIHIILAKTNNCRNNGAYVICDIRINKMVLASKQNDLTDRQQKTTHNPLVTNTIMDTHTLFKILHELRCSENFRNGMAQKVRLDRQLKSGHDDDDDNCRYVEALMLVQSNTVLPIDYNWTMRVLNVALGRVILEDCYSWLSTLGGAFSALGEDFNEFSIKAGLLAAEKQFKLALLLGDQRLLAKCYLFVSLSLCQLGKKRQCVRHLKNVVIPYLNSLPKIDNVLKNMYLHILFRLKNPFK